MQVHPSKCKCNLYFKSVYQLQETRATKALGRLESLLLIGIHVSGPIVII